MDQTGKSNNRKHIRIGSNSVLVSLSFCSNRHSTALLLFIFRPKTEFQFAGYFLFLFLVRKLNLIFRRFLTHM